MARVLMVAYSCEPGGTSEGAVGWELASRIARHHHVTLLTRPKARNDIDQALASDPGLDLRVEYHEMEFLRRLKYLGLPVSNLRYLMWNHRVAGRVAEIESKFDVIHQTTWVRHWMAPAAAGASMRPWVWGPVGAAEVPPIGLIRGLGVRGIVGEVSRAVGPHLMRLDPLLRRARKTVAIAVASSRDTEAWMRDRGIPVELAPSVGYEPELSLDEGVQGLRSYYISVGRLLDWKGFHLGLSAFARLEDDGSRFVIVGDGPARPRLEAVATRLGIAHRVDFLGRVEPDEAVRRIASARMLVHPSLHDSGGFVVVEALARGIPVVCLDIGGPPLLAGDAGIAVTPKPVRTVVERLAAAMEEVDRDRDDLSIRARERAESELAWDRIAARYSGIYERILDP